MKKIILTCIVIVLGCSINTQIDSFWTAFRDENSELIGFKDKNGRIKVEAKYIDFPIARKFDKIIAVMEENNGKNETYYLTKSGKKVGRNNIYLFDNGPDCESEGFIRFRDTRTDKVGMFNGKGEVVIPAEYDDLSNVRNGLVMAIKGAKKKFPEGNKPSDCDHYSWVEGKEYLIDTNNRIIIDNFKHNSDLDFFSLKIGQEPVKDANRQSFRGVDGRYYSFIDYQNEFRQWLDSSLLDSLFKEKLIANSYNKIYFWKEPDGWTSERSNEFINRNFELIKSNLTELNKKNSDYFVSIEGLNPFIYETSEIDVYYNNCSEPKEWQYPVMNIIINYKSENDLYQDQFEFLRTENGYKLIRLTIRDEKLK